jgi:calcineurin-like phosphoesterase family protein
VQHPLDLYSADPHFCHLAQAQRRGYATVDEHDRAVIDTWNTHVRPFDRVFLGGDCGLGREEAVLERLSELNGLFALAAGNHDAVHPMHRRAMSPRRQAAWRALFPGGLHLVARVNLSGRECLFSHLPYMGDHTPVDRFTQWRPRDEGRWLLCGHVHAEWKQLGRQVNVGLDVWRMRPVPGGVLTRFINELEVAEPGLRTLQPGTTAVMPGDQGGADEPGAVHLKADDQASPVPVDAHL